jgi:hypothetical protein
MRLRNSYFSVTLKNMHHLHFSRKKVQLHFSVKKVQLVAVTHIFKLQLHFSKVKFLSQLKHKQTLFNLSNSRAQG